MKCLDCGMEMEQGTVEGIGQSGGHCGRVCEPVAGKGTP